MPQPANEYVTFSPHPDKWLQPDGSITTHDGTVVEPPNTPGAELYKSYAPQPNKTILPDGTIGTFSSGGTQFPPIPEPKALGSYNLQIQVDNAGVVTWIWGKVV
jgi:hypothetical protein